jgi:ribosomal protein S18 acetylase RimI-like enzyme
MHPLDNAARSSLLGAHAHVALRQGELLRYPSDIANFVAIPDEPDAGTWRELAEFVQGGLAFFAGDPMTPPPDWETFFRVDGVQLTGDGLAGAVDAEAVELGLADVAEMLALVALTKPGPFLPRTIEMGRYLGIRRGGQLVAMAGERLHPMGWTEISAVCTDPAWQGNGLGRRLILALVAGIRERGEQPFLHTAVDNFNALRLYDKLGFRLRRTVVFHGIRLPAARQPG